MIKIENCFGCGQCIDKCPNNAIETNGNYEAEINTDKCLDCGDCFEFDCPAEGFERVN